MDQSSPPDPSSFYSISPPDTLEAPPPGPPPPSPTLSGSTVRAESPEGIIILPPRYTITQVLEGLDVEIRPATTLEPVVKQVLVRGKFVLTRSEKSGFWCLVPGGYGRESETTLPTAKSALYRAISNSSSRRERSAGTEEDGRLIASEILPNDGSVETTLLGLRGRSVESRTPLASSNIPLHTTDYSRLQTKKESSDLTHDLASLSENDPETCGQSSDPLLLPFRPVSLSTPSSPQSKAAHVSDTDNPEKSEQRRRTKSFTLGLERLISSLSFRTWGASEKPPKLPLKKPSIRRQGSGHVSETRGDPKDDPKSEFVHQACASSSSAVRKDKSAVEQSEGPHELTPTIPPICSTPNIKKMAVEPLEQPSEMTPLIALATRQSQVGQVLRYVDSEEESESDQYSESEVVAFSGQSYSRWHRKGKEKAIEPAEDTSETSSSSSSAPLLTRHLSKAEVESCGFAGPSSSRSARKGKEIAVEPSDNTSDLLPLKELSCRLSYLGSVLASISEDVDTRHVEHIEVDEQEDGDTFSFSGPHSVASDKPPHVKSLPRTFSTVDLTQDRISLHELEDNLMFWKRQGYLSAAIRFDPLLNGLYPIVEENDSPARTPPRPTDPVGPPGRVLNRTQAYYGAAKYVGADSSSWNWEQTDTRHVENVDPNRSSSSKPFEDSHLRKGG